MADTTTKSTDVELRLGESWAEVFTPEGQGPYRAVVHIDPERGWAIVPLFPRETIEQLVRDFDPRPDNDGGIEWVGDGRSVQVYQHIEDDQPRRVTPDERGLYDLAMDGNWCWPADANGGSGTTAQPDVELRDGERWAMVTTPADDGPYRAVVHTNAERGGLVPLFTREAIQRMTADHAPYYDTVGGVAWGEQDGVVLVYTDADVENAEPISPDERGLYDLHLDSWCWTDDADGGSGTDCGLCGAPGGAPFCTGTIGGRISCADVARTDGH